jgi:glycosyltransferase involved in cell wall biosynthesis
MKLIIQIPCYNEEKTLPVTLKDLPKKINGIDEIEILVINDGSMDKTEEVARGLGVKHILNFPKRRGLAHAFKSGIDKAIQLGADIIVNTDGDNQYRGQDIALLVGPILKNKAQIVIGCRNISEIRHFSIMKKALQYLGSHFVRKFSNTTVKDVTSGFRAYSKDAALKINIFSDYTYTLESLIQAGRNNMAIEGVDIRTNPKTRESRLIHSIPAYIARSITTMMRIYLMYEPLKTFSVLGFIFILPGFLLVVRFLYLDVTVGRSGHIQSLIIAAILIIMGCGTILLGLLGDIISANRKLEEEILYKLKKLDENK